MDTQQRQQLTEDLKILLGVRTQPLDTKQKEQIRKPKIAVDKLSFSASADGISIDQCDPTTLEEILTQMRGFMPSGVDYCGPFTSDTLFQDAFDDPDYPFQPPPGPRQYLLDFAHPIETRVTRYTRKRSSERDPDGLFKVIKKPYFDEEHLKEETISGAYKAQQGRWLEDISTTYPVVGYVEGDRLVLHDNFFEKDGIGPFLHQMANLVRIAHNNGATPDGLEVRELPHSPLGVLPRQQEIWFRFSNPIDYTDRQYTEKVTGTVIRGTSDDPNAKEYWESKSPYSPSFFQARTFIQSLTCALEDLSVLKQPVSSIEAGKLPPEERAKTIFLGQFNFHTEVTLPAGLFLRGQELGGLARSTRSLIQQMHTLPEERQENLYNTHPDTHNPNDPWIW